METAVLYRFAADAVLLLHAMFVAFVVGGLGCVALGKFLNWGWVHNLWFRVAHLFAIGVVVLQSWVGTICPLTTWEMALRARAGDATYAGSFIAHWLEDLLYISAPSWVFVVSYTAFALLVISSWFWATPRSWKARRGTS